MREQRLGGPRNSKPHDLLIFLLPTKGGRQCRAGESLLIKWSSTSRRSWWSPILSLQRVRGSKQAIEQPMLFFLLQYSRAGSARDTCSANVTRKVPGRALQLGFMDHGCESQVQECIITTFPLNAMASQSHPLQTSKVTGNLFLLQQVPFTIKAAQNFLSERFQ